MWLLVFVLVIAAVVARIKRSARIVIIRNEDGQFRADPAADETASRQVHGLRNSNVEQMLACARCGVYVPASEAVFRTGKVYCCEEHSTLS